MSVPTIVAHPRTRIPSLDSNDEYLSWGRYPRVPHNAVHQIYWPEEVQPILMESAAAECLPYGLGRSYGDSCLNEGRSLIDCSRLTRILSFDRGTGRIWCEAGVSLADILRIAVPAGWFLPVTPGTKFVTVGGAIANDVHGKNHHRSGSFGLHVARFLLCRSDRRVQECCPDQNSDLFRATIGGLGLTGVLLSAEIELKPIPGDRIDCELIPFESIAEFQSISKESDGKFEYTVSWVDCFSSKRLRGILFRGNHAKGFHGVTEDKPGPKIPFSPPQFLLNRSLLTLFNSAYYHWKSLGASRTLASFDAFFYPLDSIRQWNFVYGKAGFLQYQCVIPETACDALEEMLKVIAKDGLGSFLAVLKRFGSLRSPGMLSFPRPGLTLALDFPMRGERTLRLLATLDQIVNHAGGALYPAKDARMSPQMFEASFPKWRDFRPFVDPVMSSSFWRRVTES
jgi:FAD/FMN-containing dehydrogenase